MRSYFCAFLEMCNIRKHVNIIYRFEVNKSNYSFFDEKIILYTNNLQKSIEKVFTMQFD